MDKNFNEVFLILVDHYEYFNMEMSQCSFVAPPNVLYVLDFVTFNSEFQVRGGI